MLYFLTALLGAIIKLGSIEYESYFCSNILQQFCFIIIEHRKIKFYMKQKAAQIFLDTAVALPHIFPF